MKPLEIISLSKSYGKIAVLEMLFLSVNEGEIHGIIGENGSGKTTLMRCVAGICEDYSGKILLFGDDGKNQVFAEKCCYIPDNAPFPRHLTAGDILRLSKSLFPEADDARTRALFQTDTIADKKCGALSAGETKRLSLALAFMRSPRLLIADEITDSADPFLSDCIAEAFFCLRDKGCAILISGHEPHLSDRMCDTASFIFDGRIKKTCDIKKMKENPLYEVTFLKKNSNYAGSFPGVVSENENSVVFSSYDPEIFGFAAKNEDVILEAKRVQISTEDFFRKEKGGAL